MSLVYRVQKHEARQSKFIKRIAIEASHNARRNALSHGRSITIQQGEAIVKVHPDGSTEVIRKIENSSVIPEKRRYCL
jgi:hypothetical protein